MQVYSQLDQRWAQTKIGDTNITIAQAGCTLTCVAMSSDYFKESMTPLGVARTLTFTPDAKLVWSSIGKVFKTFEFLWREYSYNQDMIDEALKNPDKTCLLNVKGGNHWVLGIRRLFGTTYLVADPWTGMRKLYTGVVGCAILIRK